MRRLFLDTILLSFHFNDAEKRQQKAIDFIFTEIEKGRCEGYISPVTFYQLLYFFDKKINNPKTAAQRAYAYLKILQLTPFNPDLLSQQNVDLCPDYEDGLQYACARSGNCEVIINTTVRISSAKNCLWLIRSTLFCNTGPNMPHLNFFTFLVGASHFKSHAKHHS